MSDLDEFKKNNNLEHQLLSNRIKNIGLVNKIMMGVLIAVFLVNLKVLLAINYYTERSFNVRVDSYQTLQNILKKTDSTANWVTKAYMEEIHPNTLRSKKNQEKLKKIEKKIGVY